MRSKKILLSVFFVLGMAMESCPKIVLSSEELCKVKRVQGANERVP